MNEPLQKYIALVPLNYNDGTPVDADTILAHEASQRQASRVGNRRRGFDEELGRSLELSVQRRDGPDHQGVSDHRRTGRVYADARVPGDPHAAQTADGANRAGGRRGTGKERPLRGPAPQVAARGARARSQPRRRQPQSTGGGQTGRAVGAGGDAESGGDLTNTSTRRKQVSLLAIRAELPFNDYRRLVRHGAAVALKKCM